MGTFIDLSGQRFGKLVVLDQAANRGRLVQWRCACDCARETLATTKKLRDGRNRSCGCLWLPSVVKAKTKHGAAAGGKISPELSCWMSMRARCNNSSNAAYPHYGGRGIAVCERWGDFSAFLADMGPRPSLSHSIERLNNEGNYWPGNCVWALPETQARNTRRTISVVLRGKRMCARDAARLAGLNYETLLYRLRRKWPQERLFTPIGYPTKGGSV